MYDMVAQNAAPAEIVAAASGFVRFIEDGNEEPTEDNNYVWIEHPQYSVARLVEYQLHGGARFNATLEPILNMLTNPAGTEPLGLVVWDPMDVLD